MSDTHEPTTEPRLSILTEPKVYLMGQQVTDPAVIHALGNLQILTPHENLTKSDKFPFFQVPA